MDDARAEAADVIALDDASMAVEADDDATPGSLLHGDQIVATDEDDHDERPASPADASAAPAEDPIAIDGSDDDNALDDGAPDSPQSDENLDDIDGDTAVRPPQQPSPLRLLTGKDPSPRATREKKVWILTAPPFAPNRAKIRRMIAQPRARAHRDPRRATLKMPKKTKKTKKTGDGGGG